MGGKRGRLVASGDRRQAIALIHEASAAGARRHKSCEILEIGQSRMKSDQTTLAAGYASVFGFNLRQLVRNLMGEVCPKVEKMRQIAANDADNDQVKAALSVAKDLVMTKVRA